MSHYAVLDEDNNVIEVFYAGDENDTSTLPSEFSSWEEFYSDLKDKTCLRTSYNTYEGEHKQGGTPFRGNYASIGGVYDVDADIFLGQKNWESWIKDIDNFGWKPPLEKPNDTDDWLWDEELYQSDNTQGWIPLPTPPE